MDHLFYKQQCVYVNTKLSIYHSPQRFSLDKHKSALEVSAPESVSVLYTSPPVSVFFRFHM